MAHPRFNTRASVILALLMAHALVAGCGRVSPVGRIPVPPVSTVLPPAPTPLATPLPVVPPPQMPLPTLLTSPTSGCEAVAGCNPHLQLVVGPINKKKVGFLWRKLRIQANVTNKGPQPLDGEIIIRFKKSGQVVQSEFIAFALLAPGQPKPLEMTSTVAADDVEVTTRLL
ncbi:MAG: hypothetical protein VKN33_10995 [Candidatus Sericytochromatia bacterium]|nr:hypothetical protein [Candidatus Sericytochromatia bacterium]